MKIRTLAFALGLGATLAAGAQNVDLNPDHPNRYVVERGDTLWDISETFLRSPWHWPEIWQANPQINDPHLIYPGDVISLVYVDGQPRLRLDRSGVPTVRLSPEARVVSGGTGISPVPLSAVRPFLEDRSILDESAIAAMPYVVSIEEGRQTGTTGQLLYVRGLEAGPGEKFAVLRPTTVFREVPAGKDEPMEPRATEWDATDGLSVADYVSMAYQNTVRRRYNRKVDVLGYEVIQVGTAELTREGDPSTLFVTDSVLEIGEGDLLMPVFGNEYDLEFFPHAPDSVPPNTKVMGLSKTSYAAGPNQVVVINKGRQDGIENGHVFAAHTPGDTIRDEVKYPRDDVRTYFSRSRRRDARVTLPDEYSGLIMVFRTFDRLSYALVMRAEAPIRSMDNLTAP